MKIVALRDLEDQELMILTRDDERRAQEAFGILFERYKDRLGSFLYKKCGDYDLAAEMIDETFMRIWVARERYQPSAKFITYLFHVAKNYWYNQADKMRRRGPTYSLDMVRAEDSISKDIDPLDNASMHNDLELVERAMETLSEKHRATLRLVKQQGLTSCEAAAVLGIPEGTVKSRVFNAMAKVQSIL